MRRMMALLLFLVLCASLAVAQTKTPKTLDIYVIDVEGGNAVLFVAPSGESMLVDTGTVETVRFGMPGAVWRPSRTPAPNQTITLPSLTTPMNKLAAPATPRA